MVSPKYTEGIYVIKVLVVFLLLMYFITGGEDSAKNLEGQREDYLFFHAFTKDHL